MFCRNLKRFQDYYVLLFTDSELQPLGTDTNQEGRSAERNSRKDTTHTKDFIISSVNTHHSHTSTNKLLSKEKTSLQDKTRQDSM